MAALKLISLNIERSKHLLRVVPFLAEEKADVVCLQELMERDIPTFEKVLGNCVRYEPATRHGAEGNPGVMGAGIFSHLPSVAGNAEYYYGTAGEIQDFDLTNTATKHNTETHSIIWSDIPKDDVVFRIAMTHFTWTPDGLPDDFQRQDLKAMLPLLEELSPMVFCGDFNAPRGGEIYALLANRFKDCIPREYITSLDPKFHRIYKERSESEAGEKMVDYLFTTPEYLASNVRLAFGVSDHAAVVAEISKATQ